MFFKIFRINKVKSMTIGEKLRLVNGIILFIPMLLAIIGITIILLTFISGNYKQITGYFEGTDNISYAYDACNFVYDEYKKQLEELGDENIEDIYPYVETDDVPFIKILKNGKEIYSTNSQNELNQNLYDYAARLSELSGFKDKLFTIKDNNILFKGIIEHNDNIYEIVAIGKRRNITLATKNAEFYFHWILVNVIFIFIVIICIHTTGKLLYKTIFNRVEYSLKLLSDGVKRISDGSLDYQINYDRNDEFKPICDDFNKMATKLRESVEMTQRQEQNRKEVIMSISHDIFSPLTSIKAYVEGIENGIASTPEAKKKYLEIIKSKTAQIEKMISELLLYSKLEFEEISEKLEIINLKDFINNFIKKNDNEYALKNVQISVYKCEDVFVKGDRNLLTRMFTNILDNSAKYSNKTVCHVIITLRNAENNKCILSIKDDGPGVAQASIDHIFEVFYRSDGARNQTNKGSGIGLSIVSNIITKTMKGNVHAQNDPNGGLEIIIELPTIN